MPDVKYIVREQIVERQARMEGLGVMRTSYRSRDYKGSSLEREALKKIQESDGIPPEKQVDLPKVTSSAHTA